MSLQSLGNIVTGDGGIDPAVLTAVLKELRGLKVSLIATGAAAGTAMNIAAIRAEDTIVAAMIEDSTTGVMSADDAANITIQSTKASGTLTVSGNPVDGETFVVGESTYTFKTTPTAITEVKITAGDNNAMAAAVASAVNSNENRRLGAGAGAGGAAAGNFRTAKVVASVASNVVTFTSVVDGVGNGVLLSSSNGTRLAVAGNATASATITAAAAANADNFTVSGVQFNIKTTPVAGVFTDVGVGGTDIAMATLMANALNSYEARFGTLGVRASTGGTAVVTIVPNRDREGNIIPLTEAATNVAVSGSGTLAGGTATGSIKSTTNLTGKGLLVVWFDKNA